MPCYSNAEGTLHVCCPTTTRANKWRMVCSTCKKRTTMVAFFQDWYGWARTCLACGERWEDGERLERPFCPGWRKENIKHARERWARWQQRQVADALEEA